MTDFAKQLGNESEEVITEKPINIQAISLIDSADVDIQVRTARAYPRDLKKALNNILFLATQDKETADNCFYSVKRDGKTIRGASIRLAEIITSCYGNIRASSRIVSNDGKMVTAQGMCWDLENNVAFSVEVKRRITDKSGRVYSDDLVVITSNACCSIALRNAIFKVVPQAVTSRVQTEIKKIVLGEAKDFETTRKTAIEYFVNLGVTEKNILDLFSKKSIQDLDRDDIFDLRGIATAINEGDTTLESAFMVAPKTNTALGKASKILGTQVEQGDGEYEKTSDIQSNLPKVEETEKVEIKPNEDFLKGEKEIVFGENTELKEGATGISESSNNLYLNKFPLIDDSLIPPLNVELPITEEKKTEVKKTTKKTKKDYTVVITSVTDDKGNKVSPSMYGLIKEEGLDKPIDTEGKKTEEPIIEEKSKETSEIAEVVGTNNEEIKVLTIEPLPVTDIAVDTPVVTDKEAPKEKKKYKKFPKKGDNNLFNQ